MQSVGQRIKARREELNMTQDELAKRAGYKSRSSIQKIEKSRDLPLKKVKQVASILDISPSYLMGWTEDKQLRQYELGEVISIERHDEITATLTVEESRILEAYNKANEGIQESVRILLNCND